MKTPKPISDLELHFAGLDINEADLVEDSGEPENLRYQVSAKPMSEAKAKLLLKLLGEADIADHITDLPELEIPWHVDDLRELHALATYGDKNAIDLLFWAHMRAKSDVERSRQKRKWKKSADSRKGGEVKDDEVHRLRRKRQVDAEKIWESLPDLSLRETARRLANTYNQDLPECDAISPRTIREHLKKPK